MCGSEGPPDLLGPGCAGGCSVRVRHAEKQCYLLGLCLYLVSGGAGSYMVFSMRPLFLLLLSVLCWKSLVNVLKN